MLLPPDALHDGVTWAAGFDSAQQRAFRWAEIAASFASHLYDVASLLWRESNLLA